MHRLHLLRHAKAERDGSGDDKERRLSRRGHDDARQVGKTLPQAIGAIDLVLCSSAVRTRETAALVLARYQRSPRIHYEDAFYLADARKLLQRLRDLDEGLGTVLVVGHNPGLQELAAMLALASASPQYRMLAAGKFPTAARASFRTDGPWANLDRGRNTLTDYVTPKSPG